MRAPKVPKLPNEIRVELAAEIAGAMTEILAGERGITVWVVTPQEESYTETAQEIFNEFYTKAQEIVDGVFGPERKFR